MRFDWDPRKDATNERKHGLGFEEAATLFTSGVEYLEIFDEAHSSIEDRFIAIGPIVRGSSSSCGPSRRWTPSASSAPA